MVDKLKNAKEKAENFLLSAIKSVSDGVLKKEKSILEPSYYDELPLLFEAHAYICHKNKETIPKYAKELRSLWTHWSRKLENNHEKEQVVFWPDPEVMPSGPDIPDFEPGFKLESHIAMFRAKEVLGITGFEKYFDLASTELKDFLLETDLEFSFRNYSNFWLIVRSPIIRLLLDEYFEMAALILRTEIKESKFMGDLITKESIYMIEYWIKAIFFLLVINIKEEYTNLARKAALKLLDHQHNYGSFFDKILTT